MAEAPITVENPKLIIVRGPSGSGKSTVAKEVQRRVAEAGEPIGLVDQDYYKEQMILPQDGTRALRLDKMYEDAAYLLGRGCHVLMDGTIDPEKHKVHLDELVAEHPIDNHLFWFNLSFEETLRRHVSRSKSSWVSEADMRGWYRQFEPMGYDFEHEIPADMDLSSTVAMVGSVACLNYSGSANAETSPPES